MLLEINNLKQSINELSPDGDIDTVRLLAAKKLKVSESDILSVKIVRKSIDAREKNNIMFVYSADVEIAGGVSLSKYRTLKDVLIADGKADRNREGRQQAYGTETINNRPIIIGSGPAGLFAGLILAEHGYKPLILERGYDVDRRSAAIDTFFKSGIFDENSNVQFGEGGAGTFSDGKLTTRIKDNRVDAVLAKFIEAGAPKEIAYINKPHIGTDTLKLVVKNLRNRIIELGGEVRFSSKVTDIAIKNGSAYAVSVNGSRTIESNVIIAALGHSARDTYEMLFNKGVRIIPKPFSIGVRIEHLQSMIDEAQYGKFAGHPKLGAADYILTFRSAATGRAAYSFCMCPGGMVVAAASENGMLVTNGMSEYKRDKENANSALVVSVSPEDFMSSHPMAGVEYQRIWEGKAYEMGGRNFHAPVQLVGDFFEGRVSRGPGSVKPSYAPGIKMCDLNLCLPDYVTSTMKEAIKSFDRKIKGFGSKDAVLTGVETRTSAPVRIVRNENMECENVQNLYPIGEGAGYAGGIVSAAVDGIKAAEKIMQRYKPL
ncbi:MAG: FAD-dependent protein [Caulobacteraceae bacterium]